jgi:flagellar M-ring protein FliF
MMNLESSKLLEQIAKAPARTKAVVALSVAAVVLALGIGGWISSRPHFVKLYSELGDRDRVAVEKALATAEIRYRVSDFPGPFVVYVDEARFDEAQIAVALADALEQAPQGIDSAAAGASTIFMSAGERSQTMQKREWQEAERLLEQLDFVRAATVTTSMPDASPLRAKKPVMVSVALAIAGSGPLSDEQAANVAKLVRYRFGVPPENVVITDQSGRTLFDPTSTDDEGTRVRELFDHAAKYDRDLAAKANGQIEAAFGPRKGLVTVTSQWDYDQSTVVDEKVDPKAVAVQTETRTTQTPQGSSAPAGGPAGVTSNVPTEFGNESAAVPAAPASSAPVLATSKDEKKTFETSKSRTQTVRSVPRLERLSVALVVDETLAAKKDEIQRIVEAAVGFDRTRQDVIGVTTTSFVRVPRPAGETAPAAEAPGETTKLWLERGVEIACALAFLFLLVTSLRGSRSTAARAVAANPAAAVLASAPPPTDAEIDPELLARAQIEELVKSDPRRVGEILSRWVDDRSPARA